MDIKRFAKILGYSSANDREYTRVFKILSDMEMVEIQQNGFPSDSLHHHKIVAIKKPIEIDYFKRVILTQTPYNIRDFTVHKATKKFRCQSCRETINKGQRYGSHIKIGIKRKSGRRTVYDVEILCLPCLIEKFGLEELM